MSVTVLGLTSVRWGRGNCALTVIEVMVSGDEKKGIVICNASECGRLGNEWVDDVSRILYEGLGDKLSKVFGSFDIFRRFLMLGIVPEYSIVAVSGERVIGFAGIRVGKNSWLRFRVTQLIRELGLLRLARVAILGLPFRVQVEEDEVFVDAVVVDEAFRGRGIGSSLLRCIFEYGGRRNYRRVRLYVVEHNKRIMRLYERLGFRVTGLHRLRFPWSRVFGFRYMYEMIREL